MSKFLLPTKKSNQSGRMDGWKCSKELACVCENEWPRRQQGCTRCHDQGVHVVVAANVETKRHHSMKVFGSTHFKEPHTPTFLLAMKSTFSRCTFCRQTCCSDFIACSAYGLLIGSANHNAEIMLIRTSEHRVFNCGRHVSCCRC